MSADGELAETRESRATLPQRRLAARQAQERGDAEAVRAHWADFRHADPTNPDGYIGAIRSLRQMRRLDLATGLANEAVAAFPQNVDVLVVAARLAASLKNAEDTERFWQMTVAVRPDDRDMALEAIMAATAWKKGRRPRMALVFKRLQAHHQRFPDHAAAYAAHITALRLVERFEKANPLAAEWVKRFPEDVGLRLAIVTLLEDQKRFDDALAGVTALRDRVGPSLLVETALVRALSCAGQWQAAEDAFAQASERFPRERTLLLEHARIASRRGEWEDVVRRLSAAQATLPGDTQIARELRFARQYAPEAEPEPDSATPGQAEAATQGPELAKAARNPDAALMTRFESLGGTIMGCEFGMLQRELGSATVGLLRWSETNPPELIQALDCAFEGVGQEENTELRTVRNGAGVEEYITRDKRFFMSSHTFIRTSDAPADRMHQQTCRRLRFLRGKLIEILQAGEMIFVYRAQAPIDDATIVDLHAAIARYGDNALLCVRRTDEHNPPSSLRVLGRGVFAGYVTHFKNEPGIVTGSDNMGWVSLCRQADALWQADRGTRQAA